MPSIGSLSLSPSQRAALDQLRTITSTNPTGGNDTESDVDERTQNEIAVLESVQWDVERAANAIFSQPSTSSVKASTSNFGLTSKPMFEPFQVDDTAQGQNNIPSRPPSARAFPIRIFLSLLSLASFPLTLTFSIISHIFRLFRIPLPRAPGLSLSLSFVGLRNFSWRGTTTGSTQYGRIPDDPFLATERLVRNLEEETGAISVSRARALAAESSSVAGPSSAPLPLNPDTTHKLLPDFHFGSYESALQLAQRDARPLCVVLLSDEHDDTPAFQHNVLTDPDFVRVLTEGEFIVWAGDIRGAEGYQASLKLSATTYPFIAFIGLQPRLRSQTTNSTSGQTSLTILSRHPSSNTPVLTSHVLTTHITTTIIPRITPLRLQALARKEERRLREEQDAAFLASERADAERIRRRRTEEEQARERAVLEGDRLRKAEEEARAKALEEERYKNWLGWSVSRMNHVSISGSDVRVGVRMPDGKRAIRRFSESDEVDSIYIWVGAMLYGVTEGTVQDGSYEPFHRFTLAVAFPRSEVPFEKGQKIGQVAALKGGANLVVEGFTGKGTDDGSESEDEGE